MKTVAGFYPLMIEGFNKTKVQRILKVMKSPDFATAGTVLIMGYCNTVLQRYYNTTRY